MFFFFKASDLLENNNKTAAVELNNNINVGFNIIFYKN